MKDKICNICNKDHSKKNSGPITTCELEIYRVGGSRSKYRMGSRNYRTFGAGRRIQLNE